MRAARSVVDSSELSAASGSLVSVGWSESGDSTGISGAGVSGVGDGVGVEGWMVAEGLGVDEEDSGSEGAIGEEVGEL